ncbi:hypothetical protein DVA67_011365 [Solirubrobacter sp. CPCC 204708]|uniref:Thioredoxin-like fold domain-containing protein n=1 Tax=Solirubrobacter deserti TaxID=2282478 RepID=A0ABT4RHS7_9ACTN|nr:hypothetical protein [Solirubrobacter deserti]MBE2316577.1 hypothetical protein [Solirubrobacter deserti]MDA0138109.1 hypothetical protein [Solirubrobacter deserti]
MRILLIGAVVFLAAWFTILKPGGAEEEVPPVQPANAAPANAAATPAGATENTPVADAAIPAEVLAKLPKDVAEAISERKTLVLGVFAEDAKEWRPMADDDRYVRNALEKTNRYDGEVFAKNISVADLSTYGPLINGLGVTQSPSVVVIDRNLKGTLLTGYVDRIAINQAIADARRDSIYPAITDEYLRAANDICERFTVRFTRWSLPTVRGHKAWKSSGLRLLKIGKAQRRAIAELPAPAEWKGFKRQWLSAVDMDLDTGTRTVKKGLAGDIDGAWAALRTFDVDAYRKLDRRFDDIGLTACADYRRS